MRGLGLIVLVALSGCAASSGAVANAAIGTALGLTAAGVNRAGGGCYASCPPGTLCNSSTGLCEELPCRGQCGVDELCDLARPVPECVSARVPQLQIGRSNPEPDRVTPQ